MSTFDGYIALSSSDMIRQNLKICKKNASHFIDKNETDQPSNQTHGGLLCKSFKLGSCCYKDD